MFHENLKTMRKAKGYTQEELAIKLNVVRQTVSKWEKGLSVPDADVLCKIADVLDTDVSTLLGEEIVEETDKSAVAQQLAKISEQLAMKNQHSKKIWKVVCIILFVILVFYILAIVVFSVIASENIVDNYSENMVEIEEK
ncbi:MAG: helix-turn-helix transcriptional regulator [Erysipelotrichaceae bacterium]|nr:helix-turn-helix domain-containing protein [Erysipelotrichaceae bacterium]MDD7058359.1 helix-turn-helix transcriptional regulator [Erysipelotrichaceae bacterium]MDY3660502.1 helix-turn-helix transcriptional regulator [Bulleidia sp.]